MVSIELITGFVLGIEYFDIEDQFSVWIDLGFIRIGFIRFSE